MSSRRSLAQHLLAPSLIWQTTGVAFLFLAQATIARTVGAAEFGIFTYATTCVLIVAVFARFGCDSAILRHGGELLSRGDTARLSRLLEECTRIAGRATWVGVALLGGYALVTWIVTGRPKLATAIAMGALLLPFVVFSALRQAALISLGRITRALLPDSVVRPVLLAALVTLAAMAVPYLSALHVMALNLAALAVAFLLGDRWLKRLMGPAPAASGTVSEDVSMWRATATSMMFLNATYQLLAQTDMLVAGVVLPADELGFFAAAKQLAAVSLLGLIAFQHALSPRFAAANSRDSNELIALVKPVALAGLAFALACTAGLALFGRFVLGFFGAGFKAAYPILLLLCLAHIINALGGPAGTVAAMIGLQRQATHVLVASSGICAVLAYVLGAMAGATGVALAFVLTTLIWSVGINAIIYRAKRHTVSVIECVPAMWRSR